MIDRHDFRDRTVSDERPAALGGILDRLTPRSGGARRVPGSSWSNYLTILPPADRHTSALTADVPARPTCSPPGLVN